MTNMAREMERIVDQQLIDHGYVPERRALSYDDEALVTAAEGAQRMAGVTPENIRDWKRRDLIQPQNWDSRGRPLYSMRDLWETEHATRQGQGARRA